MRPRQISFRIGAVLAVSAAAGCIQGPDYQKPTVEIPANYRFADDAYLATAPAGSAAWWNSFGDPVLDGLIREALASNRDLRIATARVDEFAAILAGTRSQGLPQIGYGVSGTRQRATERGNIPVLGDPYSTSLSALLSASWEIDLWGRIKRETEAARANLLATEEARRGVVLTIISSVVLSYVTLLDLDEQLRVTEETVAGRQKNVEIFEKRLAGGWISEFEMSQVRGEYEAAVAQLPPFHQAIATQENALSVLLGRNPGPITRGSNLAALDAPPVPAGLPSDLLVRRPDIMAAEQGLIASNALIGAARALFFPRISLTGVFGFASAALENLFTGPARTWSFTGDVAGPIYTGGGLTAAVDQAEARRDQSLANYELTIQNAFRDVEDSLADVRNSRDLVQTLERRVATLRRGVELARERYENGYSDYLEVLDTERSLFSAELQLASAQGDYHRAIVNLYRALGGDWVTSNGTAQSAAASQPDRSEE